MSQRSIRRALERKERKQALKPVSEQNQTPSLGRVPAQRDAVSNRVSDAAKTRAVSVNSTWTFNDDPPRDPAPPFRGIAAALPGSDDDPNPLRRDAFNRRAAANRENAQLSTGPVSPEGKAIASMNALKTGLTGRTVLLPDDDAAAYQTHVRRFFDEHQPSGDRETELVQSLADARWRLNRIPSLETGIYALGRIQFAELFSTYEPSARAALIQAHTYLTFQKQLNNLALQENRLRRHFEKDLAELRNLQAHRKSLPKSPTAEPSEDGFVFSPRGRDFSPSPYPAITTADDPESYPDAA